VWQGLVTNDTMQPLRAYTRTEDARAAKRHRSAPFRSRRLVPPRAEGRWSLMEPAHRLVRRSADRERGMSSRDRGPATEWAAAMAQQLLTRHGVVTRENVVAESIAGGFSAVYQVLKAMEDAGRIRRGYFVAGLGAAQFAMPAALDLLRSMRDAPDESRTVVMAATDPANPYGALVKWPDLASSESTTDVPASGRGPTRVAGALVVLVDGRAAAYLRRGERELLLFLPDAEPLRSRVGREVARLLLHLAATREGRRGMLIAEINGASATAHPAARLFVEEGFAATAMGIQARTDKLRPRGYGPPDDAATLHEAGIGIAAIGPGGARMAEPRNSSDTLENTRPRPHEDSETEHERIRSTNDQDQASEREGLASRRNRGYDDAVRGEDAARQGEEAVRRGEVVRGEDLGDVDDSEIDPDSAFSEVDRNDTVDE
jgi:hypothetical protein